ncbi:MFS transporter [Actibacterium lipolyticum]|uniref:Inner membrane protein YbjJ n=1 Tax=Actibacterium lipolyticum TaxID=1524263 RepID=A0A238JM55_9RHOB|nr:MFS transporter [Actibacterium lipolyticum]SMX31503.1 Inner membrane protein YbjJ [Actibacterium lipolyticum]
MVIHKTPWRAVAAMFALNGALFGMWASRIPAVKLQHALSEGSLGLLLLLMAAGAIVAFPFAGRAADRLGSASITRRVAFANLIALVLIGLAPTVWALAVALFLFGATHGGVDVAMNAWAAEVERRAERPMMSSFHAMFSLGAGVGAGTGFLAASYGVSILSHFALCGVVITAVTMWLAGIDWVSETSVSKGAPVFALPKGALFFVGLVAFCSTIGEGGIADWSAVYLQSVTGVTQAKAALGYVVFSVAMVAMRLAGDRVVQTFGPLKTARLAGVAATVGVMIAVGFGTYATALIGFVLMGLGYALIVPLAFSRAANDPMVPQGVAIASVATLGYGGILLGPPVIGFVAEATSIRVAFGILAVLALLIVGLSGALRQRQV